jgi:hypothetical protein
MDYGLFNPETCAPSSAAAAVFARFMMSASEASDVRQGIPSMLTMLNS